MILCDKEIIELCKNHGMIYPYYEHLVSVVDGVLGPRKVISYGPSSFGYDIRLSEVQFKVFQHIPGQITDPKNFNSLSLVDQTPHRTEWGDIYFVLPAHTYALGVSQERIDMPENVIATCLGKSTYARCGINVNVTPLEPKWRGHITLEIANSSHEDAKIYANEGILQLMFNQGNIPDVTYSDRKGKYQDQGQEIVTAKV